MSSFTVLRVPIPVTVDLRMRVLRPGHTEVSVTAEHDAAVIQMAALTAEGTPVACAHVLPEPPPWQPHEAPLLAEPALAWRMRGVATDDAHRRKGLAQACVRDCCEAAAEAGASLVWCNARLSADAFYTSLGWQPWGPVFAVGVIGPHVVRWIEL